MASLSGQQVERELEWCGVPNYSVLGAKNDSCGRVSDVEIEMIKTALSKQLQEILSRTRSIPKAQGFFNRLHVDDKNPLQVWVVPLTSCESGAVVDFSVASRIEAFLLKRNEALLNPKVTS